MELVNATRMAVGYNVAMEPSGRELLVIVVKGTFVLPKSDAGVVLTETQLPLVMSDTFTGEPGVSAPVIESDFAPRKHRCDVLLNGSAYAVQGRPATRVPVGLRVGDMAKTFDVVGHREWRLGANGVSATPAQPFSRMPVSYDCAFGGVDNYHPDQAQHVAFMRNPVGRGFHKRISAEWVNGSPLPNTEALGEPIERPDNTSYRPLAFGPVGRGWLPRSQWAGTYDAQWLDEQFPFLPADFDDRYYQAAPSDQQIPLPIGNEEVRLINLTSDGLVEFRLPTFDAQVRFYARSGGREEAKLSLDTIVFEPDSDRFTLTWRAVRPLRRNVFEVAQTVVGKQPEVWWAAPKAIPLSVDIDSPHDSADGLDSKQAD